MIKENTDTVGPTVPAWNPNAPTSEQVAHAAATRKPEKYLRLPEVESLIGLRKSSIYAGAKLGTFPQPVRIGARAVAWKSSDIAAWQAQRQQAGGAQHD